MDAAEAAFPRDVDPSRVGDLVPPGHLDSFGESGKGQARSIGARGFVWPETFPTLKAGQRDAQKILAFLKRANMDGEIYWLRHLTTPGSGLSPNGVARENLVKSAAMDTDAGSGVVEDFAIFAQETGWTFTVHATSGSQKFDADGTGANGDRGEVAQIILRVYPGDTILASVNGWLSSGSTDLQGRIVLQFVDASGTNIAGAPVETFTTDASGVRHVVSATAPDEAHYLRLRVGGQLTAAGGSGSVFARDARVIRAASDPSTWTNPHVDGANQTGDTLQIAGLPTSTTGVYRTGDLLRIGGAGQDVSSAEQSEIAHVFLVADDVDSDGSGVAQVPIRPQIITTAPSPEDGAPIRSENVRLRAKLVDIQGEPRTSELDLLQGLQVRHREMV